MSYTQSEIVTATRDITETIYIFSSATDSTYANDPYCRVLDLNGNWVYRDASTTIYAYVLSGGSISNGTIEYPGRLYASAGATIENVIVDGHTYICDPGAATGTARADITLNHVRDKGNVEFVLRGSNVKAYDIAVQGKKTAIQNGAYVEGLHISGGIVSMTFVTGVVDSNATTMTGSNFNVSAGSLVANGTGKTLTISGLNVLAGATATLTSAQTYLENGNVVNGAQVYGGNLYVGEGAQVSGGLVSGHKYFNVSNGALINSVTISGGTANIYTGGSMTNIGLNGLAFIHGYASNIVQSGGSVQTYAGADVRDFTQTGGKLIVYGGGQVSGADIGASAVIYDNSLLSGATIRSGASAAISKGGLLRGATVMDGASVTVSTASAVFKDAVVDAGATVTVSNGATIENVDFRGTGATLLATLSAGATGSDLRLSAGRINNYGIVKGLTIYGGYNYTYTGSISGLVVSGGTETIQLTNAVNDDITVETGGLLNIYNATVENLTQNGGTVSAVSGAAVAATYISGATIAGGTAILTTGVSGAEFAVGDGELNIQGSANVVGATLTGGMTRVSGGALLRDVDVRGTGTTGVASIYAGATGENIRISAGRVDNYGTVNGLIAYAGYNYTFGGSISGLAVSGGSATIQRTSAANDDITVETGALLNIYNAEITNLTQNGGTVSAVSAANFASPKITGATLTGGTAILTTGVSGAEFEIGGGELQIHAGANVSGATLTGGLTRVSGALLDADLRGVGKTDIASVFAGGTGENLRLSAGRFENRGAVNGLTIYDGYNYDYAGSISGLVISGGTATIQLTNAVNDDITVNDGGLLYIYNATVENLTQNGGTISAVSAAAAATRISGAVINGGTAILTTGVSGADIRINDGTVTMNGGFTGLDIGGGIADLKEGAVGAEVVVSGGTFYLSAGATGSGVTVSGGSAYARGAAALLADVTQQGGRIDIVYGASGSNIDVGGGSAYFYQATVDGIAVRDGGSTTIQNTVAENLTVYGGQANIYTEMSNIAQSGGSVYIANGATVTGLNATGGRVSIANGGVLNAVAGNTVNDLYTIAGAKINLVKGAMLTGENTGIAEGTLYFNNSAVAGHATSGVIEGLTVNEAQLSIGSDLILKNAVLQHNSARISAYGNVVVSGATLYNGGLVCNGGCDARIYDVTITRVSAGQFCTMNLSGTAEASNTVVENGGALALNAATVKAENTTLRAGGVLNINASGADTGKLLTLDVSNGGVTINNLGLVKASTEIVLNGETAGNTYTIATTGATDKYVNCGEWGLYDDRIKAGESVTNAFTGFSYAFNATGTAITVDAVTVGTKTGDASALTSDDAITGGRAVKWDSATGVTSGNVFLAGDMTSGQAWVELDGYAGGANTTLYGAQGNSFATGTVNIYAKSGSLRNLAAGANAGGTVAAVNLTVAGAELDGTGYAGGFGNVTGAVKTLVSTGTITKDFYAGALANKLDSVTSVGNVSMTVDGGTFSGNIYGASAVKTIAGKNGTRHTAGDVTLTITDGETTKGTQSCIFAGGYATGDATGTVYTVDSVSATISGGSWGEACGGRGVFGGIMASGVEAEVLGAVNITVSGDATMGNVYGGGWAQKTGAKSIVGDVRINIAGGTIANVFGGGSHSTSGGTTETGDVTITVSGGDITGAIYARGQLDGDITGAASVIFTGATDFGCDVFGYSYVGGEASDAALSFSGYTGEFSGNIGGFNGIKFDGATAMELTTAAADVSNGAWEFDLTDRASTLAGTSLLTWSGASFTDDTIKVSFADEAQAKGDWNIATVAEAFSGTTFNVEVGGAEIATGLAYNQQIASGDYQGWGFELESGVLKFKQLA